MVALVIFTYFARSFFERHEIKITTALIAIEYTNNPEKRTNSARGIFPRVHHSAGVRALQN